MPAVDSSMLSFDEYDEAQRVLVARFVSGGVYAYRGVPLEVYDQLMKSESKGSYFRDLIIDQYPTEKITDRARLRLYG